VVLVDKGIDMPPIKQVSAAFKRAPRARKQQGKDQQGELI